MSASYSRKDKKKSREEKRTSMATRIKQRAEAKYVLTRLFRPVDGIRISKEERLAMGPEDHQGLTYGEVDVIDFFPLLELASPQKDEVFVDLGSGTGKAVFTAALGFPFSKCIGIELLEGLHDTSIHLLEELRRTLSGVPSSSPDGGPVPEEQPLALLPPGESDVQVPVAVPVLVVQVPPPPSPQPSSLRLPPVELVHGDLLQEDWWSVANVVYVASLLFSDALMEGLIDRATRMKVGSRILSLKKMDNPKLALVHEAYFRFSWDMAKVYLYRRV